MLKIKNVNYESDCFGGCETCDYGSSYISNIEITFENEEKLTIETNQMYDYMLSESDYMQVLGNSQSIEEIVLKSLDLIKNKSFDIKHRIGLEGMEFKLNGRKIEILETINKNKIIYEPIQPF